MDAETQHVAAEEVASILPIAPVEYTMESAVKEVIRNAMVHDGLRRGLRESVRALDRKAARLCFLSQNCDEKSYVNLVRALCNEGNVPLVTIEDGKKLGEYCGLTKVDAEGGVRKAVRTSCAVVVDYGEASPAMTYLLNNLGK